MCQKTYAYFIWSFGNTVPLCRTCVRKRPSAYLDDIDSIDIPAEIAVIDNEMFEQDAKDGIVAKQPIKPLRDNNLKVDKAWKLVKKSAVSRFEKFKKKE
jgi:hypothetical protein